MSLPPAAINRVVIPSPVEGNPATPPTTTVIIVDDHRSFADLLAAALNTVSSMRCVGTASTASEGVARAIGAIDVPRPAPGLTSRELEVLSRVGKGMAAKGIARVRVDWKLRACCAAISRDPGGSAC